MPIRFFIGGDLVNDDGIKYLAMAIVFQAVQDYKKALKHNDKIEIYATAKDIDRYLWQLGKKYFPKNY